MHSEVDDVLSELNIDQDEGHAALWPSEALESLLFTLTHDPVREGSLRDPLPYGPCC